jgi:hypothetical protein
VEEFVDGGEDEGAIDKVLAFFPNELLKIG